MILLIAFLGLFSQISCSSIGASGGCSISIRDLDPEPIVVNSNNEFIYPEPNESQINLETNEKIFISCPGGSLTVGGESYETIQATCKSGSSFLIDDNVIYFDDISCSDSPYHTARYTGELCELNGREIEIGFELSDNTFVRQIRGCFNSEQQISLYTQYNLTKSIGKHESGVSRINFIQDDFYNVGGSVNYLYVRKNQRATINSLLGLSKTSTKYIQNNNYFLSRGHFTPKAGFVYAPQQTATFHYVNAAPQWQTVNGFNWNQAEIDTRSYAEKHGVDLIVTTGPYGVATLPHQQTGEDVELYLYVNGNKRGIPVPELYWKFVYNPATKHGVALISLNNPYQTDVEKSIICPDVSGQISWLNWDAHSIQDGYSYACDVNELKKVVPQVPDFDVVGLLV